MSFRYEDLIHLDAESLAEQDILKAYRNLRPHLVRLGVEPAEMKEETDEYASYYSVSFGKRKFEVYSPELEADGWNSWGRAPFALFKIINLQLRGKPQRLYAVGGANDLAGIFLMQSEAKKIRRAWSRPQDWPYLPKVEMPWYGQFH